MSKENLDKNTDILGGFTQIADYISSKDTIPKDIEVDNPDDDLDNNPDNIVNDNPDDINIINNDNIVDPEDFADPDDLDDNQNDIDSSNTIDDNVDDETEMIAPFVDLFSEKLGWEMGDEDKPKNIQELISFMDNLVTEGSKPTYFSEDIKKLDEYVRNGGNLQDFFEKTTSGINLDNVDMSKEGNQKAIIREYLKETNPNYSEEYINRKINRYEESGVLEEEAEDTIDLLKNHYAEKEEKLLIEQENRYQEKLKQQQLFISNVESTIEKLDNLFGVPVDTTQKKELKDYLLRVDAQGRTKYQINYSKDPIIRLIQQGFMDLNGEKLLKNIQTKANNDAVDKFKNRVKNSGKRNNKGRDQQGYRSKGGSFDLISQVSNQLM